MKTRKLTNKQFQRVKKFFRSQFQQDNEPSPELAEILQEIKNCKTLTQLAELTKTQAWDIESFAEVFDSALTPPHTYNLFAKLVQLGEFGITAELADSFDT